MKTFITLIVFILSLLLSSCSSNKSSSDTSNPPSKVGKVAKVVITPQSILITDPHQSKMLRATAYDADGNELNVDINWSSSHNDIATISTDGNASAQGVIGSTTITAEADGVKSSQVMVLVTELVGGATTVDDKQVVGDIEAVNPNDKPGIGYQYKVKLKNFPLPSNGDIIVGSGGIPIAGQVINSKINGTVTEVTLEVVPVEQVFSQLEIHEDFDLTKVDMQVDDSVSPYYTMQKQSDGSYVWTLKEQNISSVPQMHASPSIYSPSYERGPLKCTYEGTEVFPLNLSLPITHQLTHNLHTALDFSMGASHMKAFVYGELGTVFKITPTFNTALTAKVGCEVKLATLPIPIGGAISYFFGLQVPLGVGIEAGGQLELAQLAFEAVSKTEYDVAFGLDCSSGTCIGLHSMQNTNSTFTTNWILPSGNLADNLRLKPEISGFGFSKLEFHAIGLQNDLELVGAKGGLSNGADLAMIHAQCVDYNYTSDYKLSLYASVSSGNDVNQFISLFVPGGFAGFEYKLSTDLATSPKVLYAKASKNQYYYGDTVTFTVELDPATINYSFRGYNVDKISIYKRVPDGQGGYNYNWFFDMPAVDGQTKFERDWVFTQDGTVKDNYYAFIETKGIPTFGEFGILELSKIDVPKRVSKLEQYSNNNALVRIDHYNYNIDNKLATLWSQDVDGIDDDSSYTRSYIYDASGKLIHYSSDWLDSTLKDEEHAVVVNSHDDYIRDETYIDNTLDSYVTYSYTYDSENRYQQIVFTRYSCDSNTSCMLSRTNTEYYTYDEDGHILQYGNDKYTMTPIYNGDYMMKINTSYGTTFKFYYEEY